MARMPIVLAALVLALAACAPKSPAANSAAGPGAAGEASAATGPNAAANAPNYPDWARAVVPPYPNSSLAMAANTRTYMFNTSDDPATVLAWYKAHVNAAWTEDATVKGNWNATVKGVQIALGPPQAHASDVKTTIELQAQ